jgi:uncharacterized protein DUF4112
MAIDAQRRVGRRAVPEMDRLRLARFLADLLDQRFTIPGTSIRIGLDPIISLIPGIGDLLANLTGSLILVIAAQLGVPKVVLVRMGTNIAVNTVIGAIPIVGDVASIWFRSNVRNVELLQRYLGRHSKRVKPGDWLFVIALIVGLLALMGGIVVAAVWVFKHLSP